MYWILGIQSWMNMFLIFMDPEQFIQSSSKHSTFPGHTIHVCCLKFREVLCNFALENIYFDFLGIRKTLILFLWFWKVRRTGRTWWWMWEIVLKSPPCPVHIPFALTCLDFTVPPTSLMSDLTTWFASARGMCTEWKLAWLDLGHHWIFLFASLWLLLPPV